MQKTSTPVSENVTEERSREAQRIAAGFKSKKVKPHGTRTRSADRTRKSRPYHGYKNLVGSSTIVRREGDTAYVYNRIGDGMKPNHAARAVQVDSLFTDAEAIQRKYTVEFFSKLREVFRSKKERKAEELRERAAAHGLTVEQYLEAQEVIKEALRELHEAHEKGALLATDKLADALHDQGVAVE